MTGTETDRQRGVFAHAAGVVAASDRVGAADDPDSALLLREVSHDLGNQFHRLYYLIDCLTASLPQDAGATTDAQELERAVRSIHELTRDTLTYLRAIGARMMTVTVEDVVASLRQRLGGRSVALEGAERVAGRRVAIDPTLFAAVADFLCERAVATDGGAIAMTLGLTRGDDPRLTLRLEVGTRHDEGAHALVRAALARKYLEAQGAELTEEALNEDLWAWVLTFPQVP